MKNSKIDYECERLALFLMEIHDAFLQQTERNDGDLNDVDYEDGVLKLNGEFDLWQVAHAVMAGTAEVKK
jgi:hypothetical protein